MVFTESSYRMVYTPWGLEVKKRLLDRNMKQDDLVKYLNDKGFKITKSHLAGLLKGIGTSNRKEVIETVSRYLDIPLE